MSEEKMNKDPLQAKNGPIEIMMKWAWATHDSDTVMNFALTCKDKLTFFKNLANEDLGNQQQTRNTALATILSKQNDEKLLAVKKRITEKGYAILVPSKLENSTDHYVSIIVRTALTSYCLTKMSSDNPFITYYIDLHKEKDAETVKKELGELKNELLDMLPKIPHERLTKYFQQIATIQLEVQTNDERTGDDEEKVVQIITGFVEYITGFDGGNIHFLNAIKERRQKEDPQADDSNSNNTP